MQKTLKEKLTLIFISFWSIIIIVRSVIFENLRENKATQIIIRGIHVHHFFIGFVFILISTAIYYFFHGRKRFIPLLFFGLGLGLRLKLGRGFEIRRGFEIWGWIVSWAYIYYLILMMYMIAYKHYILLNDLVGPGRP